MSVGTQGSDDAGGPGDDEPVHRVGSVPGAGSRFFAAAVVELRENLRRLLGAEPLSVRGVSGEIVRCELFAEDSARLTELALDVLSGLGLLGMSDAPEPGCSAGAASHARVSVMDVSAADPTWSAVEPGVDYMAGYERAYAVRLWVGVILRSYLADGALAVTPLCAVDGRAVVRVDLTARDAQRVAMLLSYVGGPVARGG